jgi:hypothetical protein
VAGTLEHAKVFAPGTDGLSELMSHHSRDLMQMRQVMNGPSCQQL